MAAQKLCKYLAPDASSIEIKASERANSRLSPKEINEDIKKLAAHRSEAQQRGGEMFPIMMILDTAPRTKERMTPNALASALELAAQQGVGLLHCSPECSHNTLAVIAERKNTMENT